VNEPRCPDCGAAVGGRDACRKLLEELGLRAYNDPGYARTHRLAVDAYSLQHPDEFMRSAKSFAAHLTGAAAALERDDALAVNDAVQRWLSTNPRLERPEPPADRGSITIVDVVRADGAPSVRDWAASAWRTYAAHHTLARELIERATQPRAAVR